MRKTIIALIMATVLPCATQAQRIQQKLGRAVVAVTDKGQNVLVSWRKLAQEPENITYNIYKRSGGTGEYTKVNAEPVKKTNFKTTRSAIPYGSELAVTTVSDGVESAKSAPFMFKEQAYKDVFLDIDFETTILNPDEYKVKYAWPMDLDGNGEFDAVLVDRLFTGDILTGSHKIQAYTFDGRCLWTIDMGPNVDICAGQNDMVVAYDINCDGKCEVIIKSSDGTRFWDSQANTWGKYANGSETADTDGDGITDYRKQGKRNPPFYVSVVDGRTGAEIACNELKYEEVKDGADSYGRDNRTDYMDDNHGTEYAFLCGHFAICYFDGVHPSLVMECLNRTKSDKKHHNYVFAWGYDWAGGKPSDWHHYYTWSRNDKTPWPAEFHQLRVADTDGDGIDEMLQGGFGVNPKKGMVFSAGIGHGDRFDVSDIDPDRPGMEVFAIQQSELMGQVLYDAATGEHIKEWYLPSVFDVGRGRCMDVDGGHKGYEIFSLLPNLYDCKGNVIKEGTTTYPMEGSWWDGDLQRELIGTPGGSGYGSNVMITKYNGTRLIEFSKESSWAVHSGWANRPAFMGDIIGDWREEIILMKQNEETSTGIIGYSTDIESDYSFYTLQEDPHYRLDCTTRGYYQMPCTGFYLGGDMPNPPLPPTMVTDLRWSSGNAWGTTASSGTFKSFDMTATKGYADGNSIIFDISGDNSSAISIKGNLKPQSVYLINPKGHDYTFNGNGTLSGDMNLYKSLLGTVTFDNNLEYTGTTVISEGTLCVNGKITGNVSLRAKGTLGGNAIIDGDVSFEKALNYEGCRLMPSGKDGTMTFNRSLTLPGDVYIEVQAGEGKAGRLIINGDLTLDGQNTFTVNHDGIAEGEYILAECTGRLTADATKIKTRGLVGQNYDIRVEDNRITLTINGTRTPAENVTWTGNENNIWDYKSENFSVGGSATPFVKDDKVVFDDQSGNRNITIDEMMVTDGVTFDINNGTYSLSGNGGISGNGGVTKNGKGEVRMDLKNSDYTGQTVVNDGTLTITNIFDGGQKSALGAATAEEGNIRLNGGTLKMDADNMATDRIITVTDTATINVANSKGSLSLKGTVKGSGYLVKDGPGQLNFTYPGENSFAGMILKQGIIAQGAWNSTFGKTGSPMRLEGGEVQLINMNNSSTRPVFNYSATVVEGKSCTIKGTTRGAINGNFKGKGRLTIVSTGVRNDIGANFSAFEGTLTAQGENFRLMDNVTDMSKTSIVMDAGCKIGHYASNGSAAKAITTKIGSLASESADCTIGNGSDSYEIGFKEEDVTYHGTLKAKSIAKKGNGTWTLTANGSTSNVDVYAGTLQLYNSPYSVNPEGFTSGTVTVRDGGAITGTGSAKNITVNKGGTITAGYDNGYGTLKAAGNVTMNAGSTIAVKAGLSSSGSAVNDAFKLMGTTTHNGDTIIVILSPQRTLTAGEELKIFTGNGVQTGSYILKTVSENQVIEWDDSQLLTDGILKVASAITDIKGITGSFGNETEVDVYSTDGVLLRSKVKQSAALDGLSRGVYVINGHKIMKK